MTQINMTTGTDVEFPLWNTQLKLVNKYVSAIPLIDGTKNNPFWFKNGGNIQYDNVACEFATPVSHNKKEFITSIRETLDNVIEYLPDYIQLKAVPSVTFRKTTLNHPEAMRAGCDPDFNAWTGTANSAPVLTDNNLRSFGMHMHVGHKSLQTPIDKRRFVVFMDMLFGYMDLKLNNSAEKKARRSLYGKLGSYRPTEYGVEYRVLSNDWMRTHEQIELLYDITHFCLQIFNSENFASIFRSAYKIAVDSNLPLAFDTNDLHSVIRSYQGLRDAMSYSIDPNTALFESWAEMEDRLGYGIIEHFNTLTEGLH